MNNISVEIKKTLTGYRLTFFKDYESRHPSAFSKDSGFAIAATSVLTDEWISFSIAIAEIKTDGLKEYLRLVSKAHSLSMQFQHLLNLSRQSNIDFDLSDKVISFEDLEQLLGDRISKIL
jgi:hypothetical protein